MYKIAICDCDAEYNLQLVTLLRRIAENEGIEISVDIYSTYEDFKLFTKEIKYKLLFLEICNQGLSGIDFIKELRNSCRCFKTDIIFVSNDDSKALLSFEAFPVGYLVKPYDKRKVQVPFIHAFESSCGKKSISFKAKKGVGIVSPIDEILYIEVIGTELIVHTLYGEHKCVGVLSQVFMQLPNEQFYRSHRSCIVNFKHVVNVNKYFFVMCNGDKVVIAKNRYAQTKDSFLKYIG